MDCIAKRIGKYLNLHMARLNNRFLKNQLTAAKGALRFSSGQLDSISQLSLVMDQTHTATTATRCGFDHQWQSNFGPLN